MCENTPLILEVPCAIEHAWRCPGWLQLGRTWQRVIEAQLFACLLLQSWVEQVGVSRLLERHFYFTDFWLSFARAHIWVEENWGVNRVRHFLQRFIDVVPFVASHFVHRKLWRLACLQTRWVLRGWLRNIQKISAWGRTKVTALTSVSVLAQRLNFRWD